MIFNGGIFMNKKDDAQSGVEFLKQFWNKVASQHKSTTTFDYEVFKNFVDDKNVKILLYPTDYSDF